MQTITMGLKSKLAIGIKSGLKSGRIHSAGASNSVGKRVHSSSQSRNKTP